MTNLDGSRAPLTPRVATAALTILVGGCGRPAAPRPDSGAAFVRDGSGSANVTYQPAARVLERERGLALLRGTSSDGATLVFDAGARELAGLEAGDVLVVKDLLARKVIATDTVEAELFVLTEPASLGEVIRTGRVTLDVPVRFSAPIAHRDAPPRWMLAAGLALPVVRAASVQAGASGATGSILVQGEFEGWQTTFGVTPAGGRVNVNLELKRTIGGFKAVVTGEGYLADFDFSSGIEVDEGIVSRLAVAHKRLNGLMNFRWEVAKDGPGHEARDDRIKLPAALTIPLAQFVGGLPLYLEISSAIILKPAIPGGGQYSRGAFRITYDGYQSFVAKEGTIDAEGNVSGDIAFVEGQNISMMAPHGMVVAFAAPRIELVLGLTRPLKFKDIKTAADRVDLIADRLAKAVLTPADYARLKSSPAGGFTVGKAVSAAMKSDAAAYVELVTSAGTSFSGMSAIFPCTRTDLHLAVRVGASAQAFGQSVGHAESDVFTKDVVRVDPPDRGGLCERVEPSGSPAGPS
jgi:hypothetical protein